MRALFRFTHSVVFISILVLKRVKIVAVVLVEFRGFAIVVVLVGDASSDPFASSSIVIVVNVGGGGGGGGVFILQLFSRHGTQLCKQSVRGRRVAGLLRVRHLPGPRQPQAAGRGPRARRAQGRRADARRDGRGVA